MKYGAQKPVRLTRWMAKKRFVLALSFLRKDITFEVVVN
jgi:hypothetical protein